MDTDTQTSVAPDVDNGLSGTTPDSQVSVPAEKSVEQKQESIPVQVENKEVQPQVPDEPRARPSDFYRTRKLEREIREMRSQMSSFMNQSQRVQTPDPSAAAQDPFKVSDKEFFADPVGVIRKVVETVTNQSITKSVPEIISKQTKEKETESKLREAGQYISSKDFFKKDPHAKEKIEDIIADPENGLEEYQFINPMAAARIAERIYQEKYGQSQSQQRNTVVPTKAQLASMATGGMSQAPSNPAEDFAKLGREIESNPNVVFDPDFKKRFDMARQRYYSQTNP